MTFECDDYWVLRRRRRCGWISIIKNANFAVSIIIHRGATLASPAMNHRRLSITLCCAPRFLPPQVRTITLTSLGCRALSFLRLNLRAWSITSFTRTGKKVKSFAHAHDGIVMLLFSIVRSFILSARNFCSGCLCIIVKHFNNTAKTLSSYQRHTMAKIKGARARIWVDWNANYFKIVFCCCANHRPGERARHSEDFYMRNLLSFTHIPATMIVCLNLVNATLQQYTPCHGNHRSTRRRRRRRNSDIVRTIHHRVA